MADLGPEPTVVHTKPSPVQAGPSEGLVAQNISFRYDSVESLKNVSLTLYRRKVTSLMGPSGCGKSTLLRIFNRTHDLYADQHASGKVLLDGQNLLDPRIDVRQVRARIGMVAQVPTPFSMSIYENVAFGIRLHEMLPRAELNLRVEEALRRAALWEEVKDILRSSGQSLSGGQQQRLCIARTIAVRPDIILLDEPCSALDPHSTAKIEETISELKKDYTVAIVTHNLQQAARISDYTAFMYLGEIAEFGEAKQIFSSPQNERTRRYLAGHFG